MVLCNTNWRKAITKTDGLADWTHGILEGLEAAGVESGRRRRNAKVATGRDGIVRSQWIGISNKGRIAEEDWILQCTIREEEVAQVSVGVGVSKLPKHVIVGVEV